MAADVREGLRAAFERRRPTMWTRNFTKVITLKHQQKGVLEARSYTYNENKGCTRLFTLSARNKFSYFIRYARKLFS